MKNIQELVKGINLMLEGLNTVKGALEGTSVEAVKETESAPKKSEKAEKEDSKKDEPKEVEETGNDRRAELEGMSYNDLKALVSKLGGKAVGKKKDLVELILELEGGDKDSQEEVEEVETKDDEETEEDVEDGEDGIDLDEITEDDLQDFELDELKDIAKEMGLKFKTKATKKQLIKLVIEDQEALSEALEKLGYYEEDEDEVVEVEELESTEEDVEDEADEDEEGSIVDDLMELDVEELADICSENGLSTKGKKQALVDRIVEAIENGDIEEADIFEEGEEADVEGDEEEEVEDVEEILEDLDLSDLKDVAKELGIKVKKAVKESALKKSILEKDSEDIMDALVDLGLVEVEEDEEEGDDAIEVSEEVIEAEQKLEKDIRAKYSKKKLKDSQIKKFLEKYYEGDPDCADCKGCSKEELLECYIKIQKSLIDDDCEKHNTNDYYERGEVGHCCGKELQELENGNLYCSVCGEEYSVEE